MQIAKGGTYNNNINRNPGKPQTNEHYIGIGGGSNLDQQQILGTLKSLLREKRTDRVSRSDLYTALKDKMKDRNKVDHVLDNLFTDGFLLEEDGMITLQLS
jgi:hypothetical protein